MAKSKVRDELYFMTPEEASNAMDECTATLGFLYDKLDRLQKRKAKLVKRADKDIKECQDEIYKTINLRNAINDAHFATGEYRDIQDLTFDDVT